MRDFKQELDRSNDPQTLLALLGEMSAELDELEDLPYQDLEQTRRAHDLGLLLRYGEHKLEKLLS